MTQTLRLPFQTGTPQPLQRLLPLVDVPPHVLRMPDQDLRTPFCDHAAPGIQTPRATRALRAVALLAPLGVTLGLGWAGLRWFALDDHLTPAEGALVLITMVAFYWVVLSVATALFGLFWRPQPKAPATQGLSVAILLPMYGEPAAATIGNAVTLLADLVTAASRDANAPDPGEARAVPHSFSLHILSDTRDPAAARIEDSVAGTARRTHPELRIGYRRRPTNTDYKSGNIREWVTRHGTSHDAMLILDADSIMGPESVQRMVDTLASEPGLGLIQTVPRVLPGHTIWQRMQSFASEVYGINLGRGFAMWAGVDGNFLGHNALVRTRAFARSAGLPHLPGRAPRGGVILSHDFVEAALLRRAGWGVRMMPEAADSHEDTPETLLGYLRRDRRWCQGNMQHLRILARPGLHPVSRFHLLQGAMAYLVSVWWLALLVLWALPHQNDMLPDLFAANPYMPNWPELPLVTQGALTAFVTLMLIGPKLLGIVAHIRDHRVNLRNLPGFVASVVVEILLSILIAPALMVHQVRAVCRTLAGFDGGWMPHLMTRPSLQTLVRFHATETLLGLALLVLMALGHMTLWLLPIAIGLALTIPLSWLVQRTAPLTWLLRPLADQR